jgi:hypothetical protein
MPMGRALLTLLFVLSTLAAAARGAWAYQQRSGDPLIDRARAEASPEKRSDLALDAAQRNLESARKAYREADNNVFAAALNNIREAVAMARSALKNGRNQKYLKRAEKRTRELARYLDDFAREAGIDDRPSITVVQKEMEAAHDQFLEDVMRKK